LAEAKIEEIAVSSIGFVISPIMGLVDCDEAGGKRFADDVCWHAPHRMTTVQIDGRRLQGRTRRRQAD
jgi:hypothetical protein